jgi:hypothetical protein
MERRSRRRSSGRCRCRVRGRPGPPGRPHGAHIRRLNPRDRTLATLTDVRIHRILRYGAVYGPPLPENTLDDDGADRGIYFMFLSAHPDALEFLKSQWVNDGGFIGAGDEEDPIAGNNDPGHDSYTVPARPLRRRLHGLERFTVTRGGEYAFLPSLPALRWLARQQPGAPRGPRPGKRPPLQ